MKKLLALLLALAMIVSLGACASGGSDDTSANQPSQSTDTKTDDGANSGDAAADDAKTDAPKDDTVYNFVASTHTPSTTTATVIFQNILDEITERSDGRIQFELYTDGTLAAADGIIDALDSGIADVAMVNYSRQSGRLDLFGVVSNPAIFTNPWEGTKAFMELYDTVPALKEQLEGVGMHMMGVQLGTSSVVMSKEPVNDISDLAGKRVITGTDAITDILTSVGATPLSFSNTEAYEALSKGTADAIASNSLSGAVGFGMQEVAKYVYDINLGVGPMLFTISNSAYDKLPADLQEMIDEVAREYVPDVVYKLYVLEEGKETTTMQTLEDAGVTIVEPTEEQVADFQAKYGEPIWDKWVSEREADGYTDARELMDTLVELCGKYAGTCPF